MEIALVDGMAAVVGAGGAHVALKRGSRRPAGRRGHACSARAVPGGMQSRCCRRRCTHTRRSQLLCCAVLCARLCGNSSDDDDDEEIRDERRWFGNTNGAAATQIPQPCPTPLTNSTHTLPSPQLRAGSPPTIGQSPTNVGRQNVQFGQYKKRYVRVSCHYRSPTFNQLQHQHHNEAGSAIVTLFPNPRPRPYSPLRLLFYPSRRNQCRIEYTVPTAVCRRDAPSRNTHCIITMIDRDRAISDTSTCKYPRARSQTYAAGRT